jgi:hypothetical protein
MAGRALSYPERIVAVLAVAFSVTGLVLFALALRKDEFLGHWGTCAFIPCIPLALLLFSLFIWLKLRDGEPWRRGLWLATVIMFMASAFWDGYAMLFVVTFPTPLSAGQHHGMAFCEDLAALCFIPAMTFFVTMTVLSLPWRKSGEQNT